MRRVSAGADTVTFNGIGLWHDGFERKNGPLAWFYETRNFALANVLAVPGYHWWHLFFRYLNLCARSLFSLKYASASTLFDLVLGVAIAYVIVRTTLPGRGVLDALATSVLACTITGWWLRRIIPVRTKILTGDGAGTHDADKYGDYETRRSS